jgi:hypothetical protein
MLSPNGEKSRLNKRQWIQVRTPSFKRWFGDWQNQNISDKADAQMIAWSNGELKASDIIRFGNTSHILQQFGFPDLPVEMAQSVLKKAVNKKHNVEIGDLKGLGTALQYPLAILKSKHGPEHRVLLTKLRHKDGNIVVAVELNATQMGFEVSDITSVHPKRDESVMRWVFEDNLLVAYDKSKGREWLEDSARSNSSQPQDITTLDDYSMYDVEGFVNTSKVVDSNGEPLVVYHGTASDFTVFDASKAGKHFNDPTGFYFTNNTSHSTGRRDGKLEVYNDMTSAGAYAKNANVMMDDKGAPNIMPVFVNLKNPLIITEDSDGRGVLSLIESRTRGAGYALQEAQAEGHDGIVVTDTGMTFESTGQNETVVAATDPNQIKSATGNTGAFSLETDDIRYSSAPAAAVEATRAALAEAKSYFTDSTPGELAQGLARMLNPFDWSRLRQNFETITPDPVKDAMGWLFGNPVFQAERDPDKRAFVDAGIAREENKIGFDLRFMGWDGHSDKKSTFLSRLKSTYTQWGDSDKSTAWGRIQDQNRKLSSADQQAVNVLLVEGDRRSKVYITLEKALLNKTVAAAKPSAAAFAVYKSVRRHIDTVVAREREKIFTEMSRKAGMDEEAIKRHISDYRQTLSERPGWLPRNHGDGKHQVNVYQIIKELKFEVKSVNTEGHGDNSSQAYLPYYAGPQATEKLTALVGKINEKYGAAEETRNKRLKFGAFINGTALTANGQLIVTGSKQDVAEFVQRAQAVLPEVIEENIQNLEDLKGERIKKQEQGAGEADLKELDALIEAAGDTRVKVKVFMQLHNSKAAAQKVLKAVKSDLKTAMPVNYRGDAVYEIPEVTTAGGMSESSFGDLMGDFAMERAQIETINRMMKSGEISKEEYKKLRENIIKAAAEVLMGRGAGRHQIQRAPYLIEGYETENAIGLYHDYMTSTAGMLSKAEYAKQQFDNFRNAPNAVKPWAEAYIRYNLRNMGLADRISGNARAVATFWYLGFKVSSILINGTQVWTLGVAELGRRTKQNAVKAIARAQGDIMRGKLSAEEQELFDSKIWKLQEMETAVHEISGSGEGVTGTISENFHQLVNKAMMPFQEMELLNRRTMILAAYRSALADGMAKAEAVEFALDVNRKTNFEMSRANLPGWAQNPMGRTAYALQSFVWNNWNWIYNRATSGEKADMLALLKYAAMLSAIGGVAALAGGDEADKLLRRFTGKSYKLELEKWTRRHAREYGTAGELLNAMVWHGGVGALGVNVSNAMRLNIPMSGFITGDKGAGESAMGVFAGLADKASRTAQFASQGQYARALESAAPTAVESPLRALRMVTKGATTAHGKQIFDEQGQPVKYSAVEGIGRGLGFQPLEQSRRMEAAMATNKAVTYWNEKRGDLLDQLRLAGNGPDRRVVMDEIKAFNRKVKDSQAWPKVNIISFESIRRSEQVKPDRKKQAAMRNNI